MAKKRKKTKKKQPSNNGKLGRDNCGKFAKGNKISLGNRGAQSKRTQKLKKALTDAITEKDIKAIIKKCLNQAKAGNKDARKEIFDRLWGKPIQGVDVGMGDEMSILFEAWLKTIDGSGIRSPIEQIRGKG